MIKKIIVTILSGIVLLCTAACSGKNAPAIENENKLIGSNTKEEVTFIQGTSTQESSTQGASTQESSTQGASAQESSTQGFSTQESSVQEPSIQYVVTKTLLNELGMTLSERVAIPEGYARTDAQAGSLTEFLRNYPLKEAGAEVLLYNTMPKGNQGAHAAVFALPIEEYDLQQCADSIMRVYAEYFWSGGQYDKIAFHFTNGFLAEYTKWREGYRIEVDGNNVFWSKTASYDDSYECFVKYMKMVFTYAGTLSMEREANQIRGITKMR